MDIEIYERLDQCSGYSALQQQQRKWILLIDSLVFLILAATLFYKFNKYLTGINKFLRKTWGRTKMFNCWLCENCQRQNQLLRKTRWWSKVPNGWLQSRCDRKATTLSSSWSSNSKNFGGSVSNILGIWIHYFINFTSVEPSHEIL